MPDHLLTDDPLQNVRGMVVSGEAPDVTYRLERPVGQGTFAVAVLALRCSPEGEAPVILKALKVSAALESDVAALMIQKERAALGRLNQRVPPTPFVVRLLDSGTLTVPYDDRQLGLPFIVLEYVHGGVEGATLEERLAFSIRQTGQAFDPARAALALSCIASGLEEVHEVGVVHRDLTTANILCTGFGDEELFKITDFGIARREHSVGTFMGSPGGTPGFAPPEQIVPGRGQVGPASDVFALAAVTYRLLTGTSYLHARSTIDSVVELERGASRSIRDEPTLDAELKARPEVCDAIDEAIARGMRAVPRDRPDSPWAFASPILLALHRVTRHRLKRRLVEDGAADVMFRSGDWVWRRRQTPGQDIVIRGGAWDGQTCLSATDEGLRLWDGNGWRGVDVSLPGAVHCAARVAPGSYVLGGAGEGGAWHARYRASGVANVRWVAGEVVREVHGDPSDLAVLSLRSEGQPPLLQGMAAGRALKPVSLKRASVVGAVARLDDERWLVAGRSTKGAGFAAVFSPLQWEVERLETPPVSAFLACAAHPGGRMGLVVGTSGRALRVTDGRVREMVVEGEPDLTAAAVDASGHCWAASLGRIWLERDDDWQEVWHDPAWRVPFVSLHVQPGLVVAITADGGVVEGRWEPSVATPAPPSAAP